MQVASQFMVSAPREEVFVYLQDARRMAPCIPGCKNLREEAPGQYAAVMEVGVAFLKLKFDVSVQITEAVAPDLLKAKISGKPSGLAGQLTMVAEMVLTEPEPNKSQVAYSMEISMTGKLGSIGQSAFRAKAEEMGQLFARNVKAAIEGAGAEVLA